MIFVIGCLYIAIMVCSCLAIFKAEETMDDE